eukprot:83216_1
MKVIPVLSRKRQLSDDSTHQHKRMRFTTPGYQPTIVPILKRSNTPSKSITQSDSSPNPNPNQNPFPEGANPPIYTPFRPPMATEDQQQQDKIHKMLHDAPNAAVALGHISDYIAALPPQSIAKWSKYAMDLYKQKHGNSNGNGNTTVSMGQFTEFMQRQESHQQKIVKLFADEMRKTNDTAMTNTYKEISTERAEQWRDQLQKERIKRSVKLWMQQQEGGRYKWRVFEADLEVHKAKTQGYVLSNPSHIQIMQYAAWNERYKHLVTPGTNASNAVNAQVLKMDEELKKMDPNNETTKNLQAVADKLSQHIQSIQQYTNSLVDFTNFQTKMLWVKLINGDKQYGLINELVCNTILDKETKDKTFGQITEENDCNVSMKEMTNKLVYFQEQLKKPKDNKGPKNPKDNRKPDKRKPKHQTQCKFEKNGQCKRANCAFKHHESKDARAARFYATRAYRPAIANQQRLQNVPQYPIPNRPNQPVHPSRFG